MREPVTVTSSVTPTSCPSAAWLRPMAAIPIYAQGAASLTALLRGDRGLVSFIMNTPGFIDPQALLLICHNPPWLLRLCGAL